jgi:hypothetical protein
MYDFNDMGGLIYIESKQQYMLDTSTWKCTCAFNANYALPCRHAIYIRNSTYGQPCSN